MSKPSDIDISKHFLGVFGECNLEDCAVSLIKSLVKHGDDWELVFHLGDRPLGRKKKELDNIWFATMCAAGLIDSSWISHNPLAFKGDFQVSNNFIKRVEEHKK